MARQSQQGATGRWQARAGELAKWALSTLVNRDDIWVHYLPPSRRKPGADAAVVPKPSKRGKKKLAAHVLTEHFQGNRVDNLVGVHAASSDDFSKFLRFDIYTHETDDESRPGDNFQAALDWADKLSKVDLFPLVLETRGSGGYTVMVLFEQPVATPLLAESVSDIASDYGHRGLYHMPPVYPTWPCQPIDELHHFAAPLPGRHPITDHWSRAWDGDQWVEGDAAIDMLINAKLSPQWYLKQAKKPKMEVMTPVGRSESGSAVYVEHRTEMPERMTPPMTPPKFEPTEQEIQKARDQEQAVQRQREQRSSDGDLLPADTRTVQLGANESPQPAARMVSPDGQDASPLQASPPQSNDGVLPDELPSDIDAQPAAQPTPQAQPAMADASAGHPVGDPPAAIEAPMPVAEQAVGESEEQFAARLLHVLGTLRELTGHGDGLIPPPGQVTAIQKLAAFQFGDGANTGNGNGNAANNAPAGNAVDAELQRVINAWPKLPSAVRAGIVAMVDTSAKV